MTPEIVALTTALRDSGLPHKVTSTQRPARFPEDRSYHMQGLAVDFAGPTPWNQAVVHPPLKAIWDFWMAQAGSLAELIYSGAPFWISGGRVLPISTLSSSLRAAHWNHVHVAVRKGWTYTPETKVPEAPAEPLRINGNVLSISALSDANGVCTGYLILASDGGVFAFGPGARFFGRVADQVTE